MNIVHPSPLSYDFRSPGKETLEACRLYQWRLNVPDPKLFDIILWDEKHPVAKARNYLWCLEALDMRSRRAAHAGALYHSPKLFMEHPNEFLKFSEFSS